MASTLAHELNQPLAAVSNFISGARRLADKESSAPPPLLNALEAAASGAQRAGEIVRRLRELVSRGTVSVQAEKLPRLIEEASVLGFVDAKLHGISHRLDLDPAATIRRLCPRSSRTSAARGRPRRAPARRATAPSACVRPSAGFGTPR